MLHSLTDFLEPINLYSLNDDEGYKDGQIGKIIHIYEEELPDITNVDIVFVGCQEERGSRLFPGTRHAANTIRKHFYSLFYWHTYIHMADLGNIRVGASLQDSYAAIKTVVKELTRLGKTVVLLGGTHDLTLAQYYAYADEKEIVEAACVDALINLDIDSHQRSHQFLMEMLTGEPNFVSHYHHIAFQSYYVHPHMLETMDKLRFDCYRVGHVKENIEEMEPVIRNCALFSFDMAAFAHAYAPGSAISPNGLNGEEACILMRHAGLSNNINTIGIYGYEVDKDVEELTARQISHMLWYLIDGRSRGMREALFDDKASFHEFTLAFADIETVFLQSKKTGRWWMQLPNKKMIACSHKDYLAAGRNEIPERWMRAVERTIG